MRYVGPAKSLIKKEEFLGDILRGQIKEEQPDQESEVPKEQSASMQGIEEEYDYKLPKEFIKKQCTDEEMQESSEIFRFTSSRVPERSEAASSVVKSEVERSSVVKSEFKREHEQSLVEWQIERKTKSGMKQALIQMRQKTKEDCDNILAEIKALDLELQENREMQEQLMQELA